MTELVGFRVASWDTPLRVNPNRQAGRYNYAESAATQYISLHPLASWAEYIRWHDLREPAALREIRLGVWAIRVIAQDLLVLDYNSAEAQEIRAEDLISDDWGPCPGPGRAATRRQRPQGTAGSERGIAGRTQSGDPRASGRRSILVHAD